MIIDITGIPLTPGNGGKNCLGNGTFYDKDGNPLECCCDECDYMICCFEKTDCNNCYALECPNLPQKRNTALSKWFR